ncbi:MAG TPA: EamA family transporter [Streptosporangiaceae bacterium]|jgi:drug/metabolite transporter (DMT)-like permease
MESFLLAVNASVCWGVSDFLGGLKTRAVPVFRVLAISQLAGLALITVAVTGWGHGLPGGSHAWLAVAAGVCSVAALGLIYEAMARETMIVVIPLAATGSIIPVAVGLAGGDAVTPAAMAGIVLALAGAPVAAWEPGGDRRAGRGLLGAALAVAAGASAGLWFTLMNLASEGDPLGATEVMRLTSCVIAVLLFGLHRRGSRSPSGLTRATYLAIAAIGVTDALAEICFTWASTSGQLAVISPLSSLYPVITVLLATAALRERVHPVQALGAACALTGAVLLAL